MNPLDWLILGAYVSLLIELTVFPIPSEASTYQLFFKADEEQSSEKADALREAQRRSPLSKFFQFLLPTALGVALFLIPLAAIPYPELIAQLFPVTSLQLPMVGWIGGLCVVAGRALTFGSVLQLRAQKRAGKLSAQGLFTLSRNPGLVGMYVFYVGNALIFPCLVLFIGFLPYVLNMHRRVLMEENHLAERIGSQYRVYLASVARYLPPGPRSQ